MSLRKEKTILRNVLLGAGVYLLDSLRDQMSDNVRDLSAKARDRYSDLRDRASDAYSTASERLSRANEALLGEDRHSMSNTAAALIGIGVGVGIGLLIAPASGEETRSNIAERVRSRFSEKEPATGTYGG
jgi:gas vesicle protein